MEEKILAELKTQYSHLGLSESYLKVYAKKLARTVKEESEIAQQVAQVEEDLAIIQSLSDQNRTLATQLKQWQAKQKENQTAPPPAPTPTEEDTPPAWAKTLLETHQSLADKLQALEQEREQQQERQAFTERATALGIDERFYHRHLGRSFSDDGQMEQFLQQLKQDQEAFAKTFAEKGLERHAEPIFGKTQHPEGTSSAHMQHFLAQEQKQKE